MRRSIFLLLFALIALSGFGIASAQDGAKPLGLPVAAPAGPSTWLLGQPYGNTVGAFYFGDAWYRAGQGLHFGIDLSMPCGTPVVAVADAEVRAVDDLSFGSAPHNLLLRIPQAGVSVLYGHLLETPNLQRGQQVRRGEVVGKSGDPDLTCDSRPHLHLEVRSLDYRTTYNPVSYIDARWNSLSTVGAYSAQIFQRDLNNPRQWLTLVDQPNVQFGGAALNKYSAAYPPLEQPPANPPLQRQFGPLTGGMWTLRRLAYEGCCFWPWWDATMGNRLYSIDGSPGQSANVFAWKVDEPVQFDILAPAPPPFTSPDGSITMRMNGDVAEFSRAGDGAAWQVNTGGKPPALDPSNQRILWLHDDGQAIPGQEPPPVQVWLADADGQNGRMLVEMKGGYAVWLDPNRILTVESEHQISTLTIYSVDGAAAPLGSWQRLRGLTVAPGGGRLMFYVSFDPNPNVNGVYTVDTQPGAQAVKLPWFGSWRWRDADSVFYIPFDPTTDRQALAYFYLPTGEGWQLTDPNTPFTVANGDWSVSADGNHIAFLNAADLTTWLIDAPA